MRGFSLIELLVTLAISGLLVTTALPGMLNLIRDFRATAAINGMIGQVKLARSAALSAHRTVTLCPGKGPRCGAANSWHEGSMLFIDGNRNGRFDGNDRLLRRFPALENNGRITWRSFRNRKYLSINGRGLTAWQNGSFRYCPDNGDARFARQAIINAQARVRHAQDSDGDGIREDPNGRPLRCS